ncbi:unnamed protein product, partial [Notodromas monacha]
MAEMKMRELSSDQKAARYRKKEKEELDPSGRMDSEREALLTEKKLKRRRIFERILFYSVFYACLVAFFAIMMLIHHQTLDENKPKYQNIYGAIGNTPGLGVRPKSDVNESALIHIKQEYEQLTQSSGGSIVQCYPGKVLRPGEVCPFDIRLLGTSMCTKENRFGYDRGNPCIILKINKVYGWIPETYGPEDNLPDEMPEFLKREVRKTSVSREFSLYSNVRTGFVALSLSLGVTIFILELKDENRRPPSVWLSCEGITSADREYLGAVEYFPYPGFPAYFFPYTKTPGYLSPLVALHLKDPKPVTSSSVTKKPKNPELAARVKLMKLKQSSKGDPLIPADERV